METTAQQTRQGAELLIDALEAAGIDTVFGVPGEETTALMSAVSASDLNFVLCRHEQAAAFMAGVHGRLTGQPAVCLATLGPGATNLVTGVADATLDFVPMIVITGQGALDRLGRESHQIIDLEALFAPVTKQSKTLLNAESIPGAVAEAVRIARAEKPGAVHLCLPEDVASAQSSAPIVMTPPPGSPLPDETALQQACDRIRQADRPVLLVGAGALRAQAAAATRQFAEATGIAVVTSFMAKGILPPDHPLSLFSVGQPEGDYIDMGLEAADLILSVGFDPVEYPLSDLTRDGVTPVVHLGETDAPADAGWQVTAQATGSLTASLEALCDLLDGHRWEMPSTFAAVRDGMQKTMARSHTVSPKGPIAPQDICAEITAQLSPDDTVLSGVGLHKLWVARHLLPKRPGQVIIPNGLAGMGLALPGAMAAARLQSKGRVLAICGDGDVLMNVQDMETAARLGLDLTVLVWEDGGYALIDEHQDKEEGETPEFRFGSPDWGRLAKAFGWSHGAVTGLADLAEVLRAAQDCAGPTLISLQVDYDAGGGLPGIRKAA
ncbi:acetolactate synthase large subunit [Dinoroseobacter sp. S375]|uniref:acetolactate synthase large subunit n=1 Tax=Dinoroseobacter sp. S375 TaxID=3415136 RepID=UPI003C7CE38B